MKTYETMPYGFRWLTADEVDEYNGTDDHRWGWMKYVAVKATTRDDNTAGYIRPWDCMIEFGMDHEHVPSECERMMFLMGGGDMEEPEVYNQADEFGNLYYSEV